MYIIRNVEYRWLRRPCSGFLLVSVILAVFVSNDTTGQVPLGKWRDHFSYNRATGVASVGNRVFAAAGSGIIIFNTDDNTVEKLSKVNGLSDVGISSIGWSDEQGLIIAGYENGNVDIIKGTRVINMPDILISPVQGSKRINSIMTTGSKAYLSCNFGIVLIDLDKLEVIETYFLGDAGIRLAVQDTAFDGLHLYAATSSGLFRVDLNAPNLLDFAYWEQLDNLPEPGSLFHSVEWFDNRIYSVYMNSAGQYVPVEMDGLVWRYFGDPSNSPIHFKSSGGYLIAITADAAELFRPGPELHSRIDDYGLWGFALRDLVVSDEGSVWVADRLMGLLRGNENLFRVLTPPGPYSNRAFSLRSYPGRTYIAAGGRNAAYGNLWHNGEFSTFREERWSSRINYDVRDLTDVIEHPDDNSLLYAATWGYGLIEYLDGEVNNRYTEHNSSLNSIIAGGDFIRIGGMAFDEDGNLWVTNSGVPEPVSVLMANGQWNSFPFGGIINHDHTGEIIINRQGHKWVLLPRGGGLFAFDYDAQGNGPEDGLARRFSVTDENNDLITNELYSIAEDANGFIWVGTNNGVVVYYNPGRVFSGDDFFARRIVVSGSRNEELGYLLNNETVTSIAIDGADRKWFGTEKSGAFLVSADGTRQIHHFTRGNSPLPDNSVTGISIEPSTGEVFIGTTSGVVSFRGDATAPQKAFRDVYVFPNPVRENYDGPVTVTGLVKDTVVKITDISGNLVYETVSVGGQAVWDGRNRRGQRVSTGVYLVFLSTMDGSETHVTKFMFIH